MSKFGVVTTGGDYWYLVVREARDAAEHHMEYPTQMSIVPRLVSPTRNGYFTTSLFQDIVFSIHISSTNIHFEVERVPG